MIERNKKIKDLIQQSKSFILSEPAIVEMSDNDISIYLEKAGKTEIRCGVAAYKYVSQVSDFSCDKIVRQLSNIDVYGYVSECIGYILLSEHHVSVIDMMIEAGKAGLCDKILPFVQLNIVRESEWIESDLDPLLNIITNPADKTKYLNLILQYAILTVKQKKEDIVIERIMRSDDNKYIILMNEMIRKLYDRDVDKADRILLDFLNSDTQRGIRLAIRYANESIYKHIEVFESLFDRFEQLTDKNEYADVLIPLYVTYLRSNTELKYREQVVEILWQVSFTTQNCKEVFLNQITYDMEDIGLELKELLAKIIKSDCKKSPGILRDLDNIFYFQWEKGERETVLDELLCVFCANGYGMDYGSFWNSLQQTLSQLMDAQCMIIEKSFKLLLNGNDSEMYFAVSLIYEIIDVDNFSLAVKNCNISLSESDALIVLRGILYFVFATDKVCSLAWGIMNMIDGNAETYATACLNEIYVNYPYTYSKRAEKYIHDSSEIVADHAKKILELQNERLRSEEIGYNISDLKPSYQRMEEYNKAKYKYDNKMRKISELQSIWAQFADNQNMKYGKRYAFLQTGLHNEKSFKVGTYSKISVEMELARLQIDDPYKMETLRLKYLHTRSKKGAE